MRLRSIEDWKLKWKLSSVMSVLTVRSAAPFLHGGSPADATAWRGAFIESFNGKPRDEYLSANQFL